MDMPLDNAWDPFREFVENQSMWLIDKEMPTRTIEIHNIDIATSLVV